MSQTVLFNRMPRIHEPLPEGEVKIPGPPSANPPAKTSPLMLLMPLAGVFAMVAIYGLVMKRSIEMVIPMVAMSGVSMTTGIIGRAIQRKTYMKQLKEKEAAYAKALDQKRAELDNLRMEQRRIRMDVDPDLETLLTRARTRDPRLWERTPSDGDFLSARLGIGELPSTVPVKAPHPDMPDPRLKPAHRIEAEYAAVREVPVTASLRVGPMGCVGELAARTGLARALTCNLAVHHSPDEVHLLAVCNPERAAEWKWLKWLPHTYALGASGLRHLSTESSPEDVLKDLLEELHRRQNQLDAAQHGEAVAAWPWLVLLVDDYAMVRENPAIHLLLSPYGRRLNVTALFLVDHISQVPQGCVGVAEIQPDQQLMYSVAGTGGDTFICWPEYADVELGEQFARTLAPIEVYTLQSDSAMPTHVRLLDMLGIGDVEAYDVARSWQHRLPEQYLKVPIGERRGNQPLVLDLDHTGHGPHGLIAGTTGSGKSELLQTLVVSLALTHHPHDVGFVLVDFKGGGAFSDLVDLPHTLGMVTDLGGNLTERALVALEAEVDRRKRLFNEAGVADIGPYQDLYWRGKVKHPLPRLVVIIDEFAELVSDYPDFMDGLIAIARVGRSLGVHLILATQSPGGVVKQQIWANAKFRICLRVESRGESQDMLHRPEAANLPRVPGRGYMQVGNNDVFELFQVARVAGRYHTARKGVEAQSEEQEERIVIAKVAPGGQRSVLFDSRQARKEPAEAQVDKVTDMDVVVRRLVAVANEMGIEKLPSPWPDPLPDHLALPDLLAQEGYVGWDGKGWEYEHSVSSEELPEARFCLACGEPLQPGVDFCGVCGASVQKHCHECGGSLPPDARFCAACGNPVKVEPVQAAASVPDGRAPNLPQRPWLGALLGVFDDPANQRQVPFLLELDQQDGQLIVIGAPGSGKDMWARTLITSLARTHTPDELHFYLLEFGGQALKVFENLPHVGGVFTPLDGERVRRLLLRLLDALDERKQLCNAAKVDGLVRLRELQPDEAPAAIAVMITGFAEFRTMFADEMLQLTRLIREGGPYGIHIVMIGDRVGDVPMTLSSVVARRVALRLADAADYSQLLGARIRLGSDYRMPFARGWFGRPPLEFQTATPGHEVDESAQIAELQQSVDRMSAAWQGSRPEPVEVLSGDVSLEKVLSRVSAPPSLLPEAAQTSVPVGLDGVRMRPVLVDLVDDGPDFLIAGTPQGGKTTLLWTWALTLAEFNSPLQVQFVLVSGRRDSLKPLRGLTHVLDYCRTPDQFCGDGVLARLTAEIERREEVLSGSPTAAEELPHIVVLIDDYDEFCSAVGSDMQMQDGLEKLAKRGRDVEIHSVIAGPLPDMGAGYGDALIKQLKIGRSGFLLRILDATDSNPLGLRVKASEVRGTPPGRGYVVRNGTGQLLQVATPGDGAAASERASRLRERWQSAGVAPASWPEDLVTQELPETQTLDEAPPWQQDAIR